jgi:hypothetical protein
LADKRDVLKKWKTVDSDSERRTEERRARRRRKVGEGRKN